MASGKITPVAPVENGNVLKFPDGTMIQRKYINIQHISITNAWGSGFYGSEINLGNWAEPFYSAPYVFCQVYNQNSGVFTSGSAGGSTISAGTTYLYSLQTRPDYSCGIQVIGIGFWK